MPGSLAAGLVPGHHPGTTLGLGRLLGQLRAAEMLILCRALSAEQALKLGLLPPGVPREELLDTALELAGRLADGGLTGP
ncbi:hypothetical protein DFAR_2390003 [Desulfarculales bacterium]